MENCKFDYLNNLRNLTNEVNSEFIYLFIYFNLFSCLKVRLGQILECVVGVEWINLGCRWIIVSIIHQIIVILVYFIIYVTVISKWLESKVQIDSK